MCFILIVCWIWRREARDARAEARGGGLGMGSLD